ncbi:hypothetical protein NCAS_0B06100 [Naumovozyma castellii]|uniref:Uncharacterized protein n=1 Tax=Naumovozyma castellii TaxID=27288 RepID=G0V9S7_NAUCA|nr:hypothetical protein NCAS_0B06100 [Naumovozyma castellii CBS 4309]CCC68694.1 hypothetical protein NCAS_0B06100 [Naumovozyma castellii CBS 4309]
MSSPGAMKRPIQIEEFKTAIKDMSEEELKNIRYQIENSVSHLERSNKKLEKYIAKLEGLEQEYADDSEEVENIEAGDLQLFRDSVRENQIVLKNYNKRLDALDQENIYRTSGHVKPSESVSHSAAISTPKASNSIYL